MIGPKGPGSVRLRKPFAPDLLKKLVPYWNQCGGINMPACPTCGEPK